MRKIEKAAPFAEFKGLSSILFWKIIPKNGKNLIFFIPVGYYPK